MSSFSSGNDPAFDHLRPEKATGGIGDGGAAAVLALSAERAVGDGQDGDAEGFAHPLDSRVPAFGPAAFEQADVSDMPGF